MHDHLSHLTGNPRGLYVPFLSVDPGQERSPAVELVRHHLTGRAAARRHRGELLVQIRYRGELAWIAPANLAHRNCDHCIGIWEDQGARYHQLGHPDALFTRHTDSQWGTEPILLHATNRKEIPA